MTDIIGLFSQNEIMRLVIILGITFGLTEIAKAAVRKWTEAKTDNVAPRLIAFVIGYVLTIYAWPETSKIEPRLMALFIGVMNPAIYLIMRDRWPKMAKAISLRGTSGEASTTEKSGKGDK